MMNEEVRELMLRFVRSSLWGTSVDMKGQTLAHDRFLALTQLATQQSLMGLVSQGLMDSGVRLEREDALNLYALQQNIRRQNRIMDEAVVSFSKEWSEAGIRFSIMKGQTLAAFYPDSGLRQSGDIDFLVHPENWEKAIRYVREVKKKKIEDDNSEKHVEWLLDGVQYEMHRWLTAFAYPKHHRYWEKIVVPEIWKHPFTIDINGYEVPTLSPTYNVLFIFVHIFFHLIIEGIGLRQFCDWAVLLNNVQNEAIKGRSEKCDSPYEVATLERHLEGIGLRKAFTGLGAILTDYLGLPEEKFPFAISQQEHQDAKALMDDILEKGNFGHNIAYKNQPGVRHGIEHLGRIFQQSRTFAHYAPAEVWWRVPYMFKWWAKKITRMIRTNSRGRRS